MRIAAFLALIFALAASAGRAASCSVNVGWHVALASDAVDPDVFVWDSRPRLVDYAAGRWGNTHAVLAHTMLVQPGTEALVVACAPGAARPEYTSTVKDVVGVKDPQRAVPWTLRLDPRRRRAPDSRTFALAHVSEDAALPGDLDRGEFNAVGSLEQGGIDQRAGWALSDDRSFGDEAT